MVTKKFWIGFGFTITVISFILTAMLISYQFKKVRSIYKKGKSSFFEINFVKKRLKTSDTGQLSRQNTLGSNTDIIHPEEINIIGSNKLDKLKNKHDIQNKPIIENVDRIKLVELRKDLSDFENSFNIENKDAKYQNDYTEKVKQITESIQIKEYELKLADLRKDLNNVNNNFDNENTNTKNENELNEIVNKITKNIQHIEHQLKLSELKKDLSVFENSLDTENKNSKYQNKYLDKVKQITENIIIQEHELKLSDLRKDLYEVNNKYDNENKNTKYKNDHTEKITRISESIQLKERELQLAKLKQDLSNFKNNLNPSNRDLNYLTEHSKMIIEKTEIIKTKETELRLEILNKELSDFRYTIDSTIVNNDYQSEQMKKIEKITNLINIEESQNKITELKKSKINKLITESILIEEGKLEILLSKKELSDFIDDLDTKNTNINYRNQQEERIIQLTDRINSEEIQQKILILTKELSDVNSYKDKNNPKFNKEQSSKIKEINKSIRTEEVLLSKVMNKIETGIIDYANKDIENLWKNTKDSFSKLTNHRQDELLKKIRHAETIKINIFDITRDRDNKVFKLRQFSHSRRVEPEGKHIQVNIKNLNAKIDRLDIQLETELTKIKVIKYEANDNKIKFESLIDKIQNQLLQKEATYKNNKKNKIKLTVENKKIFKDEINEINDRISELYIHIKEETTLIRYEYTMEIK